MGVNLNVCHKFQEEQHKNSQKGSSNPVPKRKRAANKKGAVPESR